MMSVSKMHQQKEIDYAIKNNDTKFINEQHLIIA